MASILDDESNVLGSRELDASDHVARVRDVDSILSEVPKTAGRLGREKRTARIVLEVLSHDVDGIGSTALYH